MTGMKKMVYLPSECRYYILEWAVLVFGDGSLYRIPSSGDLVLHDEKYYGSSTYTLATAGSQISLFDVGSVAAQ